jgi:GTP-binding protein LepA
MKNIRNFSIIAHIDHGKSTLADRMLEITGTIEKRKMHDQVLDSMDLERERGITIKMQPVRMIYEVNHTDNGMFDSTQNDAEIQKSDFLYEELSYKIRGVFFDVRKKLGLGHKEQIYHSALEIEFKKANIKFESKVNIPINYDGQKIGFYQPDFVIEDKILIELKSLPEIGRPQTEQIWSYLKGCDYKLAFLVNFGSKDLTIKRIVYGSSRLSDSAHSASLLRDSAKTNSFILNLIDTPGHIDFSYEVSRALKAVEGSILLVDATQGVQAQTLTTLNMAREAGLVIIPALTKIDSPLARVEEVKDEVIKLLSCEREEILLVSGKTGEGVKELLDQVILKIPPPKIETDLEERDVDFSSLVFDFQYSTHRGVIVFVRAMEGKISRNSPLIFKVANEKFNAIEVGIFAPDEKPVENLSAGEIGYIVTGIKEPGIASVGDTVNHLNNTKGPLSGYFSPKPVVWASIYPESQDDFVPLKQALGKLKLSDSSYTYEEESSGALGRGFRCGFLGMLHLEIITERLRREFDLELVVTMPTITYEVTHKNPNGSKGTDKKEIIYSPSNFPDDGFIEKVFEPWVNVIIITPVSYVGSLMQLLYEHEANLLESENFGDDKAEIKIEMPLRELMRNFFDKLKSITSGYASISYEIQGMREANVTRLDILVADEVLPAFSRVVSKRIVAEEAENAVEKLAEIIPRQMFAMKIQGKALGRIISSRSVSAFRKDVTQHMYGGDITRKMKLREKQKKGKKKMQARGKVNIPHEVFLKMMKN